MKYYKGDLFLKKGGGHVLEVQGYCADLVHCTFVCGTEIFLSPEKLAESYVILNQGGSPEENQRIMRLGE